MPTVLVMQVMIAATEVTCGVTSSNAVWMKKLPERKILRT